MQNDAHSELDQRPVHYYHYCSVIFHWQIAGRSLMVTGEAPPYSLENKKM